MSWTVVWPSMRVNIGFKPISLLSTPSTLKMVVKRPHVSLTLASKATL
jgi:hypothetical protein